MNALNTLLEPHLAKSAHLGSSNLIGAMVITRMVHLRRTTFPLHSSMNFIPGRQCAVIMGPSSHRGLVAKFQQLRHGATVITRRHKRLHRALVGPDRPGPERHSCILQQRHRQIAGRVSGLPGRYGTVIEERQKELPGPDPKACDRYQLHALPPAHGRSRIELPRIFCASIPSIEVVEQSN